MVLGILMRWYEDESDRQGLDEAAFSRSSWVDRRRGKIVIEIFKHEQMRISLDQTPFAVLFPNTICVSNTMTMIVRHDPTSS